jgi:hypothetical protein
MKCLTCRWCTIDFGEPALSDITPGYPGSWYCMKNKWRCSSDTLLDGKEGVERAFTIGETCKLWEDDGRHK